MAGRGLSLVEPGFLSELQSLREEIQLHATKIYSTTWVVVALMLTTWTISQLTKFKDSILLVPTLGVGWVWAMARANFLIHRAGAFLQHHSQWESSEPRHRKKRLLGLLDLLSMVPVLFLMWQGLIDTLQLGYIVFCVFTVFLFFAGLVSMIYVATIFSE